MNIVSKKYFARGSHDNVPCKCAFSCRFSDETAFRKDEKDTGKVDFHWENEKQMFAFSCTNQEN